MKLLFLVCGLSLALACAAAAQKPASAAARDIHQGNQDWITGMKTGDAALIAAAYAPDALNCGPTGQCDHGRAAVEARYKTSLAALGHALSASVTSAGSVRRGGFVYEWGSATATFADGKKITGPYLTVWQRQPGGAWKIFRNLALPRA